MKLLEELQKHNLSELASEIAPDLALLAETVEYGLKTLLTHMKLVQGYATLLYEMT